MAEKHSGFKTSGIIESDVATGVSPLIIASTTKVTNLNADLLDGLHASEVGTLNHTSLSNIGTNTHPQIDTHLTNKIVHVIDACRGITPTVVGFSTAPTNLGNATDGNQSTKTGVGIVVADGGAEILFDLGKEYLPGIFIIKFQARTYNVLEEAVAGFFHSQDGVYYAPFGISGGQLSITNDVMTDYGISVSVEPYVSLGVLYVNGMVRYLKISLGAGMSYDAAIALYEVSYLTFDL